ncbi:MAG: hypothetical protein IJT54_03935 [Candidatus Methanomethylophilaceae archaeon]|nr:hypothetical protein [Candidatus Methanomethylophilaceae archaeon]
MKRTLPTASSSRGVAKATYADKGPISITAYVETSAEAQQLHGITDGTLFIGYTQHTHLSVGDRLAFNGRTYEILSVIPHTTPGSKITFKEVK